MIVIGRISFWIHKSFDISITEALEQFRKHDYVEKLMTHITTESIPSDKEGLFGFLYNLIIHI